MQGLRSDYLSPAVYLTDILIVWLLLTQAIRFGLTRLVSQHPSRSLSAAQSSYLYLLVGLVAVSALSLYQTTNLPTGWWHLGKLIEFGLFGLVVSTSLKIQSAQKVLLVSFLGGVLVQSFLALGQFLLGQSLGFWFLGERTFNLDTPGMARAVIEGKLVLRSYGTLSHPNVLALFLLVGSQLSLWQALKENYYWKKLFFVLVTVVSSLALLSTLSRLVIFLWLVGAALILFFSRARKIVLNQNFVAAVVLVLSIILLLTPPLASRFGELLDSDRETITQRLELNNQALKFIGENPLSGVGLGNFVPRLAEIPRLSSVPFYQPTHNLYLLVASEVGIIGLVFLVTLLGIGLFRVISARQWLLALIAAEVIIAGLFDHYFWSLQQGGLIFWSIVGGLFSPMVGRGVTRAQRPAPRS